MPLKIKECIILRDRQAQQHHTRKTTEKRPEKGTPTPPGQRKRVGPARRQHRERERTSGAKECARGSSAYYMIHVGSRADKGDRAVKQGHGEQVRAQLDANSAYLSWVLRWSRRYSAFVFLSWSASLVRRAGQTLGLLGQDKVDTSGRPIGGAPWIRQQQASRRQKACCGYANTAKDSVCASYLFFPFASNLWGSKAQKQGTRERAFLRCSSTREQG